MIVSIESIFTEKAQKVGGDMGEPNASWFPLKLQLQRCRCNTEERGKFYYKRSKFKV